MITQFIAFLRAAPETEFDFFDSNGCALAQFGKSLYPYARITAGADYFKVNFGKEIWVIPEGFSFHAVSAAKTFGQMADALEAQL